MWTTNNRARSERATPRRPDAAAAFKVPPRRWLVERTLGWPNRRRRLRGNFENLTRNALAFVRLASLRLMLRKICDAGCTFRTETKA
jgi:transposase